MLFVVSVNFLSVLCLLRWSDLNLATLQVLSKMRMTIFGTVLLLCLLILCLALWKWPLVLLLLLHAPVLIDQLSAGYQCILLPQRREQDLRSLIDVLILEMRTGEGFRVAIKKAVETLPAGELQAELRALIPLWPLSKASSLRPDWFLAIVRELQAIELQPHQSIARLQGWRLRLKKESDFRRRSGQVLAQVRLQAAILFGLYFALLLWALVAGEVSRYPGVVFLSAVWMAIGILLVLRMGTRVKWNF